MKKFTVKFQRDFEAEIEAVDIDIAGTIAHNIVAQFPAGTCKLLSVLPEGYVPPADPEPVRPRGGPPSGGTPGTPVVKQEILADQIAKAA